MRGDAFRLGCFRKGSSVAAKRGARGFYRQLPAQ